MAVDLTYNASYQLLRTNPKLSTNAKIIVDTEEKIYLDSFSANDILSDKKYKKWDVSYKGNYENDLHTFFDDGSLKADVVFDVLQKEFTVKNNFNEQYNNFYWAGADYVGAFYQEDFSYFAPLWLDETLPDYFIICRNSSDLKNTLNPKDIFKDSTIIKSYSLKQDSPIGEYIRRYNDKLVNNRNPVVFNFRSDVQSSWFGINLAAGGFVKKNEYIDGNYLKQDKRILESEDFITSGFKRNYIVCPNIMNMQFLFNDPLSSEFKPHRYFGFYVSENQLGSFRIDGASTYKNSKNEPEQTPAPRDRYTISETNLSSYVQENPTGISVYPSISSIGTDLGFSNSSEMFPITQDLNENSFYYFKGKSGEFYNLKNYTSSDPSQTTLATDILDWQDITGESELLFSNTVDQNKTDGTSRFEFKLKDIPNHGDRFFVLYPKRQVYELTFERLSEYETIRIKHTDDDYFDFSIPPAPNDNLERTLELAKDEWEACDIEEFQKYSLSFQNGKLYIIERAFNGQDSDFEVVNLTDIVQNGAGITIPKITKVTSSEFEKFVITAIDQNQVQSGILTSLKNGSHNGRFFSNQGSIQEVANAFVSALNFGDDINYNALITDKTDLNIALVAKSDGFIYNRTLFGVSTQNNVESLEISPFFTSGPNIEEFTTQFFAGGGDAPSNKVTVNKEDADSFIGEGKYIKGVRPPSKENSLLSISYVGSYLDEPTYDSNNNLTGFNNINSKATVYTDNSTSIFIDNTKSVGIYDLYQIPFGVFSIFDVKDLDFDYTSTEYGLSDELKLEMDFYKANYDGVTFKNPDIKKFYDELGFFRMLKFDEVGNLVELPSEYDVLNENSDPNYRYISRSSPFINKWVSSIARDSKDNFYRLNAGSAFGESGLLSLLTSNEAMPFYNTHEWFYLQKMPKHFGLSTDLDLNKVRSYFDEGIEISEQGLYGINKDYFKEYFTVDKLRRIILLDNDPANLYTTKYKYGPAEPIAKQTRYSKFNQRDNVSKPETFFRGVKFQLDSPRLDDLENPVNFNDYKFSAVLVPHNDTYGTIQNGDDHNPIDRKRFEIEFIENRKFKTIAMVIFLEVDNFAIEGALKVDAEESLKAFDRTSLYCLDTLYSDPTNLIYGNIEIQGVIDTRAREISGTDFNSGIVKGISDWSGSKPNFVKDIQLNSDGYYNSIQIPYLDLEFDVDEVISRNELKASNFRFMSDGLSAPQPTQISKSTLLKQTYIYKNGGYKVGRGLFDYLSLSNVKTLLDTGSDYIKYTTVLEDGQRLNDEFSVTMLPQTKFEFNDRNYHRYTSSFKPKANSIIESNDYKVNIFDDKTLDLNKRSDFLYSILKNKKTSMLELNSFGTIKNLTYHTVSKEVSDNNYALGKKDLNVFDNNWTDNFYEQLSPNGVNSPMSSKTDVLDIKTMMGSKLINLGESFEVENFTIQQVEDLVELDKNKIQNVPFDISWAESDNNIWIDIRMTNAAVNVLYDSMSSKLSNYISEPKLIKKYIMQNILDKYNVDVVNVYAIINNNDALNSRYPVANSLTESEKLNAGYSITNNYQLQKSVNNKFDMRIIINKVFGYYYSFSPSIKMIKV